MPDQIEFLNQPVASSLQGGDVIPLVRGQNSYQLPIETLLGASQYAVARETQSPGQNGGQFPFGDWYTRHLNEHQGVGALVGHGVQLPAGRYLYFGFGMAMQIQSHQTRLMISDGSIAEPGLCAYSPYALSSLSALGPWVVDVNGSQIVFLQHRCGRDYQRNWGLGYRANFGLKEVYAGLLFLKV